jgi:hypothetical protein
MKPKVNVSSIRQNTFLEIPKILAYATAKFGPNFAAERISTCIFTNFQNGTYKDNCDLKKYV